MARVWERDPMGRGFLTTARATLRPDGFLRVLWVHTTTASRFWGRRWLRSLSASLSYTFSSMPPHLAGSPILLRPLAERAPPLFAVRAVFQPFDSRGQSSGSFKPETWTPTSSRMPFVRRRGQRATITMWKRSLIEPSEKQENAGAAEGGHGVLDVVHGAGCEVIPVSPRPLALRC